MKFKKLTAIALIASLILSACANSPYADRRAGGSAIGKTEVGTVIGGAAGALAGAQFGKGRGRLATTAIGTLIGAGIGNSVGASLDRADIVYYERSAQSSLEYMPVGQTSQWRNPDSGNYGTFTPIRTYQVDNGRYCREFTQRISVGGAWQEGYGTACRQPDGSWEIVS